MTTDLRGEIESIQDAQMDMTYEEFTDAIIEAVKSHLMEVLPKDDDHWKFCTNSDCRHCYKVEGRNQAIQDCKKVIGEL